MIKIEDACVNRAELRAAIRGMRNPMNSWDKADSAYYKWNDLFILGENDMKLATNLIKAGPEHRKFLRMIHVSMDITAPLYWWKEFDTYKIGTVANSCSTMHKITAKEFEWDDFSFDHLGVRYTDPETGDEIYQNLWVDGTAKNIISGLNQARSMYLRETDPEIKKQYWWQIIQLLPTSYNQKRTVDFNYETALTILKQRKGHKLDEWREFRDTLLTHLPYMKEFYEASESKGD